MALNFRSRSQSLAMPISTQPEEEQLLKANSQAADWAQIGNPPRPSFAKRGSDNIAPRHRYPSALARDGLINQPVKSHTAHTRQDRCESERALVGDHSLSTIHERPREAGKPWRSIIRRKTQPCPVGLLSVENVTTQPSHAAGTTRKKSRKACRSDNGALGNEHSVTRIPPEEPNRRADVLTPPRSKPIRTIKKSVYGSLSNTKSFFRSSSKPSNTKTPHLDSFKSEVELKKYIGSPTDDPTVLSIEKQSQMQKPGVCDDKELAELSGESLRLRAELEDNSPDGLPSVQLATSRISTPSIPYLPPYPDEKRVFENIRSRQSPLPSNHLVDQDQCQDSISVIPCTCIAGQHEVSNHKIHQVGAICDADNHVICTKCIECIPHCRRGLEDPLRAHVRGDASPKHLRRKPVGHQRASSPTISMTKLEQSSWDIDVDEKVSSSAPHLTNPNSSTQRLLPGEEQVQPQGCTATYANVRLSSVDESESLHRERELAYRERELGLRAREIDVRDQQTTLREREVIVQQRIEQFAKESQTLALYQQLAKNAFIGAQFQSYPYSTVGKCPDPEASLTTDNVVENGDWDDAHLHDDHVDHAVVENQAQTKATNFKPALDDYDAQMKSYATQKRKKENASGSTSSTSGTSSSPEQPRKTISRGNSERGASQDEEDDNEDHRIPKRSKQEPATSNGPQILFACPYSKNDPNRFSSRNTVEKNYRGCGTHYLPDVSRLKQHLRRVHWQPENHCHRCYKEFDSSARLNEHYQAEVACPVLRCPFPEKMDKDQQDRIHVKRPRVPQEKVWYDIYKVLFPGQPLPESPYTEADVHVHTPNSATPRSDVHVQAMQILGTNFNHRLDQHEQLRDGQLRSLIQQALDESFAELQGAFTLSPAVSPISGPPIVISPVSRTSSDSARALDSPATPSSNATRSERNWRMPTVPSQPLHVPQLQHPQPPKSRARVTEDLAVPHDFHRSPTGPSKKRSLGSRKAGEVIFDVSIPRHVTEDVGYDGESRSFEEGDDQYAMAFVPETALPSSRKQSNRSIDSGYGSGKLQHPVPQRPTSSVPTMGIPEVQVDMDREPSEKAGTNSSIYSSQEAVANSNTTSGVNTDQRLSHNESKIGTFRSYSDYLDREFQEELAGYNYSLLDPHGPLASHDI